MGEEELFPAPFLHKGGERAQLFSSHNRKTVSRHFAWMEEHGIDGVFLQRFGSSLRSPKVRAHRNTVTANVRAGAKEHGRSWAMMYDLSGLRPGEIESVVMEDWSFLSGDLKITADANYQRHRGKPLVAVWGVGFAGPGRKYELDECERLVDFLRAKGNAVMLGVPSRWRTLRGDAVGDEALHRIMAKADVISPWTVGRYGTPRAAAKFAEGFVRADIAWCKEHGVDYLPVAFPGFSWHNLKRVRGQEAPLDQIPRLGGRFLWSQARAFKGEGAKMLYVAMFDEVDEGTAIFKCTNDPPVGDSPFLTYEGLPSDHYLWLTGQIAQLFRGQLAATEDPPVRR